MQSEQFVTTRTEWRLVCLLIAAGYVAAFQVGKAAIALPLYRQDLGLSLTAASWVVGAYATLGATAGLMAGAGVSLMGARRSAIGGLLVIALGSGLGALARDGTALLLTRVVEGCGFIAVVIAAATLVRSATAPRHRDVVLTCWSTYMPGGSAVMMLVGPALAAFGWPALWAVNAALAALTAVALWALLPRGLAEDSERRNGAVADVASVMRAPGAVLLATAFGIYTFQYFALTGLLPTLPGLNGASASQWPKREVSPHWWCWPTPPEMSRRARCCAPEFSFGSSSRPASPSWAARFS